MKRLVPLLTAMILLAAPAFAAGTCDLSLKEVLTEATLSAQKQSETPSDQIFKGDRANSIVSAVEASIGQTIGPVDRVDIMTRPGTDTVLWVFSLKGCVVAVATSPHKTINKMLGRPA